jgi:hypothetical protein
VKLLDPAWSAQAMFLLVLLDRSEYKRGKEIENKRKRRKNIQRKSSFVGEDTTVVVCPSVLAAHAPVASAQGALVVGATQPVALARRQGRCYGRIGNRRGHRRRGNWRRHHAQALLCCGVVVEATPSVISARSPVASAQGHLARARVVVAIPGWNGRSCRDVGESGLVSILNSRVLNSRIDSRVDSGSVLYPRRSIILVEGSVELVVIGVYATDVGRRTIVLVEGRVVRAAGLLCELRARQVVVVLHGNRGAGSVVRGGQYRGVGSSL